METKDNQQVGQSQRHCRDLSWSTSSPCKVVWRNVTSIGKKNWLGWQLKEGCLWGIQCIPKTRPNTGTTLLHHKRRNCFACLLAVNFHTGPVEGPRTRTQGLCTTDSHHPLWDVTWTILWCFCTRRHCWLLTGDVLLWGHFVVYQKASHPPGEHVHWGWSQTGLLRDYNFMEFEEKEDVWEDFPLPSLSFMCLYASIKLWACELFPLPYPSFLSPSRLVLIEVLVEKSPSAPSSLPRCLTIDLRLSQACLNPLPGDWPLLEVCSRNPLLFW